MWVYILQSVSTGRFYVGHTDDLERRLKEHNEGLSRYTRRQRPWNLVWSEEHPDRSRAMVRELEIKSRKSRKYLIELVGKSSLGERPVTTEL